MGLFDSILSKIQQVGLEAQKAQMEAEDWDVMTICRKLQRTSSVITSNGYIKTLQLKCKKMNDWELKNTFDHAYDYKNVKACNAMMKIMEERGLAYKDDNGRIVRKYH